MTEERCPHYKQMVAVDYERDKVYEGYAMCDLVDKFCLRESGLECEIYDEWLEELNATTQAEAS